MTESHLEFANQTYFAHAKDSLKYSGSALKASFFFFIHSLFPNRCQKHGSKEITKLYNIIQEKYTNIKI